MQKYKKKSIKELWDKFKSPLGKSSIDNKFNSMYDLEKFLEQKIEEAYNKGKTNALNYYSEKLSELIKRIN